MMEHRGLVLGLMGLVTAFFLWQIRGVVIESRFSDLLPQGHEYIKVHNEYKDQLGDPLKVFMMLQVKEGNIYREETLTKVQRITDELDAIPGVNHNQVYSIGSRKIKKIKVTDWGIESENFMEEVPQGKQELGLFQRTVRTSRGVFGVWVSPNEQSVLFTAAFIPELVDFGVVFERVQKIIADEEDEVHVVFAAGEPMLKGWVKNYQQEMYQIFGVTFVALFVLLYLYFRNMVGVIVPIASTCLGISWGLGFTGVLGYNIEPLTLVIPLLIAARALSHSVQVTERYFECYDEIGQVKEAAVASAASILPPGLLGIVTDSLGILLIAVAPIPIMQKMAYICSFWASCIFITGVLFTPLLISFFKPPKNVSKIVDKDRGITQWVLKRMAALGYGTAGKVALATVVVLFGVTFWISLDVEIGDVNPGSPILWPDSEFNIAVDEINKNYPGTDELLVIMEGSEKNAIANPHFMDMLDRFQRHMEQSKRVAFTLSLADLLAPVNRAVNGGHAKWEIFPNDRFQIYQLFNILTGNAAPGDFDRYVSREEDSANVIIWAKDHMGETIREAVGQAKDFIDTNKAEIEEKGLTFKLASGNLGVLAAANETVKDSQTLNFILVMGSVFILCSLTYRSIWAAIILMVPLNLANLITMSIMKYLGIGLNINTLPIVSVGVGVGIDYGIYLLSRLCEEYKIRNEYSFETAASAIQTTGKAIFFTATTMIVGVIFWYFLSSLRFQAEMGLLLAIIMFINMVGALIIIPTLVYIFKPKFLGSAKLLVRE
jgi:predicted RND superfamily exporter protein